MSNRVFRAALLVLCAATLAGCAASKPKDGPPRGGSNTIPDLPGDAVPRPEPVSRYGNGPVYEVLGKRYTVMPSAHGYSERGVASWYGKKFHGNLTSNREVYDMYGMTAAHKTLPLPTFVKVRNLRNNKTVVVRVNDRGPFVHNRIIDLSYAAALRLDMVNDGTSLVEVTAINFEELPRDMPVRKTTPAQPEQAPVDASEPSFADTNIVYAQVGAFGSRENAQRRLDLIQQAGIRNSRIHEDRSGANLLYRVRIGPIREVLQYDLLVEELGNLGIEEPYLVTE
jgi:rare lipoprotein A